MAIVYDLTWDTGLTPEALIAELAPRLDAEVIEPRICYRDGLRISAAEADANFRSIIDGAFEFVPTTSVVFTFASSLDTEDYVAAKRGMVRSIVELLPMGGDAVLLLDGEKVVLLRRAEELILNADWKEWTSYDHLTDVPGRYTLRTVTERL